MSVLEYDDIVALRVIIRYHRSSRLPRKVFKHALVFSVAKYARHCFLYLLDEFPQLVDRNVEGMGPIHMAVNVKDPFFVTELIRRGANIMLYQKRFSPLALSLIFGNIETAEAIFQKLSAAEIEGIFGPDEETGCTMLGRLLQHWLMRERNISIVDSIRWLHSKGGAYFFENPAKKSPAWNVLLCEPSPPLQSQVIQDTVILGLLFEFFPDKLNEYHGQEGLAPIHWAAVKGHLEAVIMLLEKGVDVNLRIRDDEVMHTAILLAIGRLESPEPPKWTVPGGQLEINRWRERIREIVRVLIAAGAEMTVQPGDENTSRHRLLTAYTNPAITIVRDSGDLWREDDETLKGDWPERFPEQPIDEDMEENRTNMLIRNPVGDIIKVNRAHAMETLDRILYHDPNAERFLATDFKDWIGKEADSRKRYYKAGLENYEPSAKEPYWMPLMFPQVAQSKTSGKEPDFDLTHLRQPLRIDYLNKENDLSRYERDMDLMTRACSLDHRKNFGDGDYGSLDLDDHEDEDVELPAKVVALKLSEEGIGFEDLSHIFASLLRSRR